MPGTCRAPGALCAGGKTAGLATNGSEHGAQGDGRSGLENTGPWVRAHALVGKSWSARDLSARYHALPDRAHVPLSADPALGGPWAGGAATAGDATASVGRILDARGGKREAGRYALPRDITSGTTVRDTGVEGPRPSMR